MTVLVKLPVKSTHSSKNLIVVRKQDAGERCLVVRYVWWWSNPTPHSNLSTEQLSTFCFRLWSTIIFGLLMAFEVEDK